MKALGCAAKGQMSAPNCRIMWTFCQNIRSRLYISQKYSNFAVGL